MYSLEAMLIK